MVICKNCKGKIIKIEDIKEPEENQIWCKYCYNKIIKINCKYCCNQVEVLLYKKVLDYDLKNICDDCYHKKIIINCVLCDKQKEILIRKQQNICYDCQESQIFISNIRSETNNIPIEERSALFHSDILAYVIEIDQIPNYEDPPDISIILSEEYLPVPKFITSNDLNDFNILINKNIIYDLDNIELYHDGKTKSDKIIVQIIKKENISKISI